MLRSNFGLGTVHRSRDTAGYVPDQVATGALGFALHPAVETVDLMADNDAARTADRLDTRHPRPVVLHHTLGF